MHAPRPLNTERQQLYEAMSPLHLTPLWEVLHALVPPQPRSRCVPALWPYEAVRPHLLRAGELITAEEAVRRVLILENPSQRGQSCVTPSLYAGLQLILPGEVAPAHRHTQSALRFVVEGRGAYTAVDGERATMEPGDFITTPSWTWHDHGCEGDAPVVWLDGLDIPMVQFFEAGFAENAATTTQQLARAEGTSYQRYGANMLPVRYDAPYGATSPIFSYPYARTREALFALERQEPVDAWDGVKLRYVNPATGGAPMPTMATYMQRLPAGFQGLPWRQTDGTVFNVVEGSGEVLIQRDADGPDPAEWRFAFGPRDTFVVPSWHTARFQSEGGCVLFSYSDRPVQQALGLHREERISHV